MGQNGPEKMIFFEVQKNKKNSHFSPFQTISIILSQKKVLGLKTPRTLTFCPYGLLYLPSSESQRRPAKDYVDSLWNGERATALRRSLGPEGPQVVLSN